MSEKINPNKAEVSKCCSGDVGNFEISHNRKADSTQSFSRHQDSYKYSRGGYRYQEGSGGRGGKYNNCQRRDDGIYGGRNNKHTNQKDEAWKNSSSTSMYSAAQSVYDMISNEKNNGPQRDRSNDNRYPRSNEQNSVQQRYKPNDYRSPNTCNNQIKRGPGNFKKNPKDEKLFDRPKYKKTKHSSEENGPNTTGTSKRRPPDNVRGNNPSMKDGKFKKQKTLLNEISNVLVQAKSFPELFSYDEMCEALLKEDPNKNTSKPVKELQTAEKHKKTPFLKNGVILRNDRGQGNIPNEFKRRKKPGRLTLLNRVRKGIPVNSDDDDDEFMEIRKKKSSGEEKKKKILDVIAKCRESREREKKEAKAKQYAKEGNIVIKKINYCDSSPSKQNQSTSSEESDEDYRNQRKSEAYKMSDNLSNDLAKFVAKKPPEPKDMHLSGLKKIIQSRPVEVFQPGDVEFAGDNNIDISSSIESNNINKDDQAHKENAEKENCEEQEELKNKERGVDVNNSKEFKEKNSEELDGKNAKEADIKYTLKVDVNNSEKIDKYNAEEVDVNNPQKVDVNNSRNDGVNNSEEVDVKSTLEDNVKNAEDVHAKSPGETNEKNAGDIKDPEKIDRQNAEDVGANNSEVVDIKNALEVDVKNAEEVEQQMSEDIDLKTVKNVDVSSAKEVDLNDTDDCENNEELDVKNAEEDEISNADKSEEKNSGDVTEDESEEDEESEDSDSDDDNMKVKLLRSLTKQLISDGKEANSNQVLELLQEKLKQLSLTKEKMAGASNTQEDPLKKSASVNSDTHEAMDKIFRTEKITVRNEKYGEVNSDVIVVCDDSTDDDDYGDDNEDDGDDDFPVLIIKS